MQSRFNGRLDEVHLIKFFSFLFVRSEIKCTSVRRLVIGDIM
jgi:hypothetical protein